ncbi:MAG: GDP-mannose 4,6-dehydratase [Planctomycetia bacterium]
MKRALITNVGGKTGGCLAEHLLTEGYEVFGAHRPDRGAESFDDLSDRLTMIPADFAAQKGFDRAVFEAQPDEIYHLSDQDDAAPWRNVVETADEVALGAARLLEAVLQFAPDARVCFAGSHEVYGGGGGTCTETSPLAPTTPRGVAHAYAQQTAAAYRLHHQLFACTAVLFPCDAPTSDAGSFARTVARAVARIAKGRPETLSLGCLDVYRDWGYAGDAARAFVAMLAADRPEDFVVGVGRAYSLRMFVETAFQHVGLEWKKHTVVDAKDTSTAAISSPIADAARLRSRLDWEPQVTFREMVGGVVDAELARLRANSLGGEVRQAA